MSRTNAYYIVRVALAVALPAATASTAVPLAMSSGLSAGMDRSPHPSRTSLAGIWSSVANGDRVHALLREGDVVWSATEGGGVVRWNINSGAYRQYFSPQHGLPDNDVRALVRDRTDTLWAATARGLARLDTTSDRWLAIPADHPEIQSHSTTALAVAGDGALWVGFEQRWDPSANGPSGDEHGAFVGGGLARFNQRTGVWGPVFRAEQTDRRGERFATIPSDNVTAIALSGNSLVVCQVSTCGSAGVGATRWVALVGDIDAPWQRQTTRKIIFDRVLAVIMTPWRLSVKVVEPREADAVGRVGSRT